MYIEESYTANRITSSVLKDKSAKGNSNQGQISRDQIASRSQSPAVCSSSK